MSTTPATTSKIVQNLWQNNKDVAWRMAMSPNLKTQTIQQIHRSIPMDVVQLIARMVASTTDAQANHSFPVWTVSRINNLILNSHWTSFYSIHPKFTQQIPIFSPSLSLSFRLADGVTIHIQQRQQHADVSQDDLRGSTQSFSDVFEHLESKPWKFMKIEQQKYGVT